MIAAADLPATNSVLDALVEILQWQFDFRKKVSANVEVLKAKNTKVKAFRLKATTAQLVLTIMANVASMAEHDYGRAFCTPLKTVCTSFKYDYKHDATLLKQCWTCWRQQTPTGTCATRQRPPSSNQTRCHRPLPRSTAWSKMT